jgi:hypothetical protein
MREEPSTDPAALLLGVLADEIADRRANRLAPQLAEIVEAHGFELIPYERAGSRPANASAKGATTATAPEDGLWTAGRVASHYDVAVRFVYQHADELGCVRLGGGPRPRLRFDPSVVLQRWPLLRKPLPESTPLRRRSSQQSEASRRRGRPAVELLEFDRP